jgi:hypothetical protein
VRPRNLFLLKAFGYSFGVFVFWSPLAKVYGWLLDRLLSTFYPLHRPLLEKWPYTASMFLIPLIALTLATPRVAKTKMVVVIGSGLAASLLLDYLKIRYGLGDNGQLLLTYSVYHSIKWLLPLLIWLGFCHDRLEGIFHPCLARKQLYDLCPLCQQEHADIVTHLQEIHGKKSLKIKKVKKFIEQREELSS